MDSRPLFRCNHCLSPPSILYPTLHNLNSFDAQNERKNILASNTLLNTLNLSCALETLSFGHRELSSLKRHIEDVSSHLEELQELATQSESAISQQSFICSAIRRFPTELIARIMHLTLDIDDWELDEEDQNIPFKDGDVISYCDVMDTTVGAWALSQVCQNWRDITLSYPRLWSRISVEFPLHNHLPLELINTSLDRSGSCPLHVLLALAYAERDDSELAIQREQLEWKDINVPVLDRLLYTSDRWLSATAIDIVLWRDNAPAPSLPSLRSLRLSGQTWDTSLSAFSHPPSLKYLNFQFDDYDFSSFTNVGRDLLGRIQYLCLGDLPSSSPFPLQYFSSLQTLAFYGYSWLPSGTILSDLRSLDIAHIRDGSHSTLSDFILPSLESLTLNTSRVASGFPSFLHRLKHMEIHVWGKDLDDECEYIGALFAFPRSLESLKVICDPANAFDCEGHLSAREALQRILSCVVFKQGPSFPPPSDDVNSIHDDSLHRHGALPRLQRFEVVADFPFSFDGDQENLDIHETLFFILQSRGYAAASEPGDDVDASVARLQEFTWRSNLPLCFNPEETTRLDDMRKQGLVFNVTVVGLEPLQEYRNGRHYYFMYQ
jgi:hypothetical protein